MSSFDYLHSVNFLRDNLTDAELYGQLAEELIELSQAVLKLQRLSMRLNWPRVGLDELIRNVEEETADVELVLRVLGIYDSKAKRAKRKNIMLRKLNRWCENIRKNKERAHYEN